MLKRVGSFLLALAMLIGMVPVHATAWDGDSLTWTQKDGVLTISGTGDMMDYDRLENWIIYGDYNENWGGEYKSFSPAFYNRDSIQSVVIGAGVTKIGNNAFVGCENLNRITFMGDAPKFSEEAFLCYLNVSHSDDMVWEECANYYYIAADVYYPRAANGWADVIKNNHKGNITWKAYCPDGVHDFSEKVADEKYLASVATCAAKAVYYVSCVCGEKGTETFEHGNLGGHSRGTDGNCTVCGASTCGENLTWTLKDGVLTISGTGAMDDFEEAPWCGKWRDITSVVIEPGATSIGRCAFDGCNNLTSIVIPEGVTSIGGIAFAGCDNLTNIVLPESITSIGSYAFSSCTSLTGIVIPHGVTSINDGTFQRCFDLASIVLPESVTNIGNEAFVGCSSLTGIVLPEGVTSISNFAFAGCSNLTIISIPAGVTTIGLAPFDGCNKISDIYFGGTLEQWAALGEYVPTATYIHYNVTNAANHWFDDVKEAFCGESGYTRETCACGHIRNEVTIPAIGKHTFNQKIVDDKYLASAATCAEQATYYVSCICGVAGREIFKHGDFGGHNWGENHKCAICGNVGGYCGDPDVNEGKNVTWTFEESTGVLTISGNGVMEGESWRSFSAQITVVKIEKGVTGIAMSAFSGCKSLTSVVIPDSMTSISVGAFSGCSSLTNIELPDSLTTISDFAFSNCNSLSDIMLPESVTSIGDYAFTGCSSLASIVIPDGVTSICEWTFERCSSLTNIVIPNSVTSIGMYAFRGCSNLTSISIPASVTAIGVDAFAFCDNISDVYYGGTAEQWAALGANVPKAANIHYNLKLAIVVQPKSAAFVEGEQITVGVVATGHNLTYQWYFQNKGSSIWNTSSITTATYATPMKAFYNGRQIYCVVTDEFGNAVTTNTVTLTLEAVKPVITQQPQNVTATVGTTATFKVVATGTGLKYQWQWRANSSSTWAATTVSGNKTATITVPATVARNGYQYRCVVTDANGNTVTSNAATLTVFGIKTQPASVTAKAGATVTFKVAAIGNGLTYQWQWRKNASSTWASTTISGNKTATISVPATAARNGYQYRCKITDSKGNVLYSNAATLTVKSGPVINTQPASVTANVGATATFKVVATGTGLTYQWQWRKNASSSWASTTVSGNRTAAISVPATAARNGYQYRCKITDANNNVVYTNAVTLTVKPTLSVTTQPKSVTANVGETATFKVVATGTGLTYQWQWRANSSSAWASTTVSGNKTATISVPATAARNGYQYRCKITDANGKIVYSNAATLTVKSGPVINTQPKSVTANVGETATFKVVATGTGLTYQWQWRKNASSTWANTTVSGNKTATITVPATAARNGYQYRCKITDTNGNVIYSNAATLTVK